MMIRADRSSMNRDAAERIALAALSTLVADTERLDSFLAATGIGPDTLREAAETPGFLVAVLDQLMAEPESFKYWCLEARLRPDSVAAARALLAQERT